MIYDTTSVDLGLSSENFSSLSSAFTPSWLIKQHLWSAKSIWQRSNLGAEHDLNRH